MEVLRWRSGREGPIRTAPRPCPSKTLRQRVEADVRHITSQCPARAWIGNAGRTPLGCQGKPTLLERTPALHTFPSWGQGHRGIAVTERGNHTEHSVTACAGKTKLNLAPPLAKPASQLPPAPQVLPGQRPHSGSGRKDKAAWVRPRRPGKLSRRDGRPLRLASRPRASRLDQRSSGVPQPCGPPSVPDACGSTPATTAH